MARGAALPLTAAELATAFADRAHRSPWPSPALLHHAGTAGGQGLLARQLLVDADRYANQFGRPFLIHEAGCSLSELPRVGQNC